MASFRVKKLESFIQKEISELIRKEVKDPRISPLSTTIVSVEVSKDLRYVVVNVSVMGNKEKKKETMSGLNSAKGFIQHKIGEIVKLRFTPEIKFELDESLERGDRIISKLKELIPDENNKEENKNL
jgi:ribosome-binding factor A